MSVVPKIIAIEEKNLVGKRMRMSYGNNTTVELWKEFMPRRNHVSNRIGTDLFSVQVYDDSFNFSKFDPSHEFDKWACVQVKNFDDVADGLESISIPSGLYAVFTHKGPASDAPKTFGYIFGEWLPASGYSVDERPHFEILPEGYDRFSENAEEDIYIPIRS